MKYFKNFFSFREFITEQVTPSLKSLNPLTKQTDPVTTQKKVGPSKEVIGVDKFEVKAKSKTKKTKSKLDYTQKYDQPEYKEKGKEGWFWNGAAGKREGLPNSNYRNEWVNKIVKNAFSTDEKKQKMVEGLKKYVSDKRSDYQTVDQIIKNEIKKTGDESRLWYVIKFLATDGKVGPFHRIVANVIDEEITPIPPETLPDDEPEKPQEEVPQRGDFTTAEKSNTIDPSTGRLGEQEKIQMQYGVSGDTNLEKILTLDYPSAETIKSLEKGEEESKNILSRLGRIENISKTSTEVSFDCVKNRNDYLKKDLYIYVFYKTDDTKNDLGVLRRLMDQDVEKFKFVLSGNSKKFECNVMFTTELFGIGDDKFNKNPNVSLKTSSNNNKVRNLLSLLTTKFNKPFSSTDHKGPIYSTQKIK